MAISFVGSQSGASSNGSNITLDLSGLSMAEGDLVIAAVSIPTTTDAVMLGRCGTKGYTNITDLYANDTNDTNLGIFYKIQPATPDASVILTGGGDANDGVSAVAMVFRGVDKTRPLDVTPTTATGTDTILANPPSITLSGAGGVATVAVGAGAHADAGAVTYGGPTNYTTNFVTIASNDTRDSVVGMGYNLSPSATENPGAFTYSTTDNVGYSWAACTIALRPAESVNIQVVGFATAVTDNGADGTLTITLPTCLENDLVIVAVTSPKSTDWDMTMNTSGYTEVADLFADDTVDTNFGVFYKKMSGTPDTTAVCNLDGVTNNGHSAVAVVFRGVDTTTPMDATATTATGVNTGIADPPSIDWSTAGTITVVAVGCGTTGEVGYILPPGYTGVAARDANDGQANTIIGWNASPADPEDPGLVRLANANDSVTYRYAAVTMALRKSTATGQLHIWIGLVGI